jgi:hypothetical protein
MRTLLLFVALSACTRSPSSPGELRESTPPAPVAAEPVEPSEQAADYAVIILGGGKSRADAEQVRERFVRDSQGAFARVPNGFPKCLSSDTVEGLNPGFEIAVLGFCADADAEQVRDVANLVMDGGVYTRMVRGEFRDTCPAVRAQPWSGRGERTTVSTKAPAVKWVWGAEPSKQADGCEVTRHRLAVVARDQVLAEKTFDDECRKGSDETDEEGRPMDLGESSKYDIEPVTVADRTFFLVAVESWAYDTGTRSVELWGYACGEVRKVLDIAGGPAGSGMPGLYDSELSPIEGSCREVRLTGAGDETLSWSGCAYARKK